MKNKLFLLIALAFCLGSYAQEVTSVSVVEETLEKESGLAFKTRINRAEEKTIAKEWKSLLKDYDGNVSIKKNMIIAEEVKIESMGSDPLRVVAEIREVKGTEHDFVVLFFKNGQVVSSSNDLNAFTAAKTIVRMFSNKLSKEATEDYQKEQAKLFESYEEELEDLQKDKEKAEKEIEDAEEEIKEAQKLIKEKTKEIEENKENQTKAVKNIEEQKKSLKSANAEVELFK